MKKIALIPSYEPDNKLIDLVNELINNSFEVIVVNDGSNSNYDIIFKKVNDICKVLEYKNNKGKGYALKYGFKYIKENYKDYIVVTMDSDGQHTVKDALKLCEYSSRHNDEIVIGKRVRSNKTPIRSRIGNTLTKMVYNLVSGINVYDTQTGLRCFSDKLIDFCLEVPGERYEYEMNVLLYASKERIKIAEKEIETIYIDNNSGSHFNALKDSIRIYKEIIKFSLSSIISFIIDYILYTIFVLIINNVTLSNILARIISSITNYNINKKIVFKNNKKKSKTFTQYASLAIIILILNTLMLNVLVSIEINIFLAKVLTEICLFSLSYFVQKKMIFRKEL